MSVRHFRLRRGPSGRVSASAQARDIPDHPPYCSAWPFGMFPEPWKCADNMAHTCTRTCASPPPPPLPSSPLVQGPASHLQGVVDGTLPSSPPLSRQPESLTDLARSRQRSTQFKIWLIERFLSHGPSMAHLCVGAHENWTVARVNFWKPWACPSQSGLSRFCG